VIVCDTGPIVAAALRGDDHHHECVELFTGLHLAGRRLVVPATVVAEVGYLIAREAGARVEAMFLTALADGDFELVDLTTADFWRAAQLVETYGDLPGDHRCNGRRGRGEVGSPRGGHSRPAALQCRAAESCAGVDVAPYMIAPTFMPTLVTEQGLALAIAVDYARPALTSTNDPR
jgi:predicted nucleic acid-binding protein